MPFARRIATTKAILLLAVSMGAESPEIAFAAPRAFTGDRAGAVYEISRDVESAEKSNGSTGSSTDRDTVLERIISVRSDGLELEYDLPKEASAQDRAMTWQFPLRIFKPFSGPPRLLNPSDLEARMEAWLKKGELPHAACGHWVFTWNAFKIECDPQSALEIAAAFDLRPNDLRNGGIYGDSQASVPTTLRAIPGGTGGVTFTGSMSVDPERVRREHAQSDVALAEINGKTLALDDAIRARSSETISGTISISFEVDPGGFIQRRTKVTKLETRESNGTVKNRTTTEILKRRPLSDREIPPQ